MNVVHRVLRWFAPILIAGMILTPITIGVVWHERTVQRRQDNCVALNTIRSDFQAWKDYVGKFTTDAKGQTFVAGLPIPPKQNC